MAYPLPSPRTPARLPSAQVLCLLAAIALSWVASFPARAADPAKDLARTLIAAPDDHTRDILLAAAPPEVADSEALRRAFNFDCGAIIFAGDFERAIGIQRYALRMAQSHGDQIGIGLAEWSFANIDGSRGDNRAALGHFDAARRIFETAGDRKRAGLVLSGESIVHLQLGDFRGALDRLHNAEAVCRELKDKEGLITVLNTTGDTYLDEGLHERAMTYWQEALALAGDDAAWQILLFSNIGNAWRARGDLPKAIELQRRSLALAEKDPDKRALATVIDDLGEVEEEAGHADEAGRLFQRALRIGEEIGDKRRQTAALTALGEAARRKGNLPEAAALADRASAIARDTGEPAYIWRSRTLAGKLDRQLGRPAEAEAAFTEAIAAVEDARGNLAASDEGAAIFLEDKATPYQEMAALLVSEGKPEAALLMAERAKARVLAEILRSPKIDPSTPQERAAATQLVADAVAANRALNAARATGAPKERLAQLEDALRDARLKRDNRETDFLTAHPELRNRQPVATRLPDGEALAGKAAALEYVVVDGETLLFIVTAPKNVRAISLPLTKAALQKRILAFRETLASRGLGWQKEAARLGEDLLTEARKATPAQGEYAIVPDGPLWELPFQTLTSAGAPQRPLWQERAVTILPSLGFLAQAATAHAIKGKPRLLAVGNSAASPDGQSAPLPDAERQAREVAALYDPAAQTVLLGAAAHEDAFKRSAPDADVIHIAAHGFLNDRQPLYSSLLMSQENLAADEDGSLEAWEWLPLKLHARLAVLSACETGRGRVGAGEGVLGLSWALFVAGCPAAVVSQWKVDSASSTELMVDFHRRLLTGASPAEALRVAGLALAARPEFAHPFYWAPFIVLGASERLVTTSQEPARE